MKNIFKLLTVCGLCLGLNSCADMDVLPFNTIPEDKIAANESGITADLVTLYRYLPIEDFNYSKSILDFNPTRSGYTEFGGIPFMLHMGGEAVPHKADYVGMNYNGTDFGAWNYEAVRNVNKFKDMVEKNQSAFNAEQVKTWRGEAYMMRAYLYFGLVKRYGGVPLITSVQTYTGDNIAELQVPRNTEKEVYDYIASQLDTAVTLLPATNQRGRFTKWAAYSLKSRAMLFAASIAKYGSMDASCPAIGIPSSEATNYYAAARAAAKEVIDNGKFSLYRANPDKSLNYTEMFINAVNNPEAIYIKEYKYPEKTHNFDVWGLPYAYRSSGGYGSNFCPTLDFVETYENIDGTITPLIVNDGQGKPIEYTSPLKIFEGKDPRLAGTIIFPNALWRGNTVGVRKGVIEGGKLYPATKFGESEVTPKGINIPGNCGFTDVGETTTTGFYLRKYMDYNRSADNVWSNRCDQDWMDFRLAEIYLNFAEAAVETNTDLDKALTYINDIRDRAGVTLLKSNELTRDRVRHERAIELSFECHRFWDLKRWRLAVDEFNNRTYWALHPYFNADNNTWFFKKEKYEPAGLPGKTFQSRFYYLAIPAGEISKNPKLLPNNPGY